MAPALRHNGGPWGGFGFDLGAQPVHAQWACDELGRTDIFTGKPIEMGGTDYDKEGIAGLGVAVAAAGVAHRPTTTAAARDSAATATMISRTWKC